MDKLPPLKNLSPSDWETLIDDFHHAGASTVRDRYLFPGAAVFDHSLSSLLKKDFPLSLKLHVLVFLDEFTSDLLSGTGAGADDSLSKLLETLKIVIQSPIDGSAITFALKEQMMISATSITMTVNSIRNSLNLSHLQELIAILLTIINRPNHSVDRQARAVACECLRELEREYPCLFVEIVGHLWGLCQNERTHASQSYILLLLEVIYHIVVRKLDVVSNITSTAVPLVPFNVPPWISSSGSSKEKENLDGGELMSGSNLKELKRVMAFLLEWPHVLTPCGMMEFMSRMMPVAAALELQVSLLKVQFFGLIYSYDPLLCHVVLMMYSSFTDAFDGQEMDIYRRLMLMSKEGQQHLVFRLLVLHWLLGFLGFVLDRDAGKKKLVSGLGSNFYPNVFDALALKSLKLDLLALCSIGVDSLQLEGSGSEVSAVKYLEDGLVCVSAFKWMPPWSTETAVAIRTLHKFLIGASSHSDTDPSTTRIIMDSTIFHTIQMMLVKLVLEFQKLVPVLVSLLDRLLCCRKHCWLGENLLQTFDEHLLPKVVINYRTSSYFPVFDRIGRNDTVPPRRLLELLMKFMVFVVENHDLDTGLKSWSLASDVLGICRGMLMHHHSSRLFIGLSRLLAFTSLYFPDLEVRDNARIYLRMLICIPGKKLRYILNLGEQLVGISPSPHSSSYFSVLSPRLSRDLKKSESISSYIHLERAVPLLVKQSWSLSLPALGFGDDKYGYVEGIKDSETITNEVEPDNDNDDDNNALFITNTKRIDHPQEPLRVMDSKVSEILQILRKHFSSIPDFRHMSGLKIKISCTLRFESESFKRVWGVESDSILAMYAIVLKFSGSGPYGSIPTCHVPFLPGEPSIPNNISTQGSSIMDIVPADNVATGNEIFRAPVTIELEPREPVPGLVNVSIEANAQNGQIIRGNLRSISVGIEDMFLNALVPPDIPEDSIPSYKTDLFNALWEACGTTSNTGRELFLLKGGEGAASINGTQSVKLLEVPSTFTIRIIERYLSQFVVSVVGELLVEMVKDRGFIREVTWSDTSDDHQNGNAGGSPSAGPLYLTYFNDEDDNKDGCREIRKTNIGFFLVLIFLPPRYHLLFRMEVSDSSTLVRIRTDHWPCLAYIDEYLEALFSS